MANESKISASSLLIGKNENINKILDGPWLQTTKVWAKYKVVEWRIANFKDHSNIAVTSQEYVWLLRHSYRYGCYVTEIGTTD